MLPRSNIFHLRRRSLLRGVVLSLGAMAASMRLAGFPLKVMLPPSVMSLPFNTKAPAAASNVMPFTVIPAKLLVFVSRVEPPKVNPVGKPGAEFQLPPVLQLLSEPRPVQMDAARELANGCPKRLKLIASISVFLFNPF